MDDFFRSAPRLDWVAARVLALWLVPACGGSLPAPEIAEHPRESYVDVPYPPPAALAEIVPPRPQNADVVWLDGDWTFRGSAFAWRRGGWFADVPGSRYAPSRVVYLPDGRLRFAPGTWYDERGQTLTRPRPLEPANSPPNEVTSEFQTGR